MQSALQKQLNRFARKTQKEQVTHLNPTKECEYSGLMLDPHMDLEAFST